MNIDQVVAYLGILSSLGAWVYSYAHKDLAAYRQFDMLRDDLTKEIYLLERRIERLEISHQHSEELRNYKTREIVDRLNRHQSAINDQIRFLNTKLGFNPRVNGKNQSLPPDSLD